MVRRAITLAILLVATSAHAQDGGVGAIGALERQLDDDLTTLSTKDCVDACLALTSLRRVAERICELEPGARCASARAKVESAANRVHATCRGCEPTLEVLTKSPEPQPVSAPAAAPPRGGGCAGCVASGADGTSGAAATALLLGLVLARRRRSRS